MCSNQLFDTNLDDRFCNHDDISILIIAKYDTRRFHCCSLQEELSKTLEGLHDVWIHGGQGCILAFKLRKSNIVVERGHCYWHMK